VFDFQQKDPLAVRHKASKSVKKTPPAKQQIYPNIYIYIYVKHFIEIILAPQYKGLSKGIKKIGGGKPRTFHKNF